MLPLQIAISRISKKRLAQKPFRNWVEAPLFHWPGLLVIPQVALLH
jgi:hypothetical protein